MDRPFNFAPGPSTMPLEVLEQAAREMVNWPRENGIYSGMGVMEMSHRGKDFSAIYQKAVTNLRKLLAIPSNFTVLFLQGGASLQNAAIPLNLCANAGDEAGYVIAGAWSKKSYEEARKYCKASVVANSADELGKFKSITPIDDWHIPVNAKYVHICSNETIHGVVYPELPDLKAWGSKADLVVDCSSDIATKSIDWERVGLVYAGAQKNLGPAGVTIVIVREDLLEKAQDLCPSIMNYSLAAINDSMLNTPPTFAIYMAGLMLEWLLGQGGVTEMQKRALVKSSAVYQLIDDSDFYLNDVEPLYRSQMNAPFFLKEKSQCIAFLSEAEKQGLIGLNGHKSMGGVRASLYNALPVVAVEKLCYWMSSFEERLAK